jgi:hypothetical protein
MADLPNTARPQPTPKSGSTKTPTTASSTNFLANLPRPNPILTTPIGAPEALRASRARQVPASEKMSDSDGEYADDGSDDDLGSHQVSSRTGTRSTGSALNSKGQKRAAWEGVQNKSWVTVVDGAEGGINATVEGLREAAKKKRYHSILQTKPQSRTDKP